MKGPAMKEKEAMVEQKVKTYFTDRFPDFSTSQQCGVQFGTRHGIADVVLQDKKGTLSR